MLNRDDSYGRFASALSDHATGHLAALYISRGLGYTVEIRPTAPRATISLSSTGQ